MCQVKLQVVLSLIICFYACDSINSSTDIYFIGDSLVARWDIEYFFPGYVVHNMGLSGSGVKWIKQNEGQLSKRTVVVLTGTNDLKKLDRNNLEEYACQYVEAIKGLGAKRLVLFSILPRNDGNDISDINQLIFELNQLINSKLQKDKTIVYSNVFSVFIRDSSLDMNLSYDGVHLNQYGYEVLTGEVKKLL